MQINKIRKNLIKMVGTKLVINYILLKYIIRIKMYIIKLGDAAKVNINGSVEIIGRL